jgi:hypothetical protein
VNRIIFGDNQFFGINHMSEDKAREQALRFKDIREVIRVIDDAYDCGVRGFMFNSHARVVELCDHFRKNEQRYADLTLYPSMPYAHKYANAVAEVGIFGALNEFIIKGSSPGQLIKILLRGGVGALRRDAHAAMKVLVEMEMKMFRGLDVRAVFLQNIVTDMLLGLQAVDILREFADFVRQRFKADVGFNTMNLPMAASLLEGAGLTSPIVCSSVNKIGYLMSPNREAYESALPAVRCRPWAMSILASGAVPPADAVDYVCGLPKIEAIVFGASTKKNIEQTCELIRRHWPDA